MLDGWIGGVAVHRLVVTNMDHNHCVAPARTLNVSCCLYMSLLIDLTGEMPLSRR